MNGDWAVWTVHEDDCNAYGDESPTDEAEALQADRGTDGYQYGAAVTKTESSTGAKRTKGCGVTA